MLVELAAPILSFWLAASPVPAQAPSAFAQAMGWAGGLGLSVPPAPAPLVLRPVPAIASLSAAADPVRPVAGMDYARVRDLFETADEHAPARDELRRWRAGRLFKPEQPSAPLNSLLVGADVDLPGGGRDLRLFPIQTYRPVDEIPNRPDLQQWVRDAIHAIPVEGPGPEFDEHAVRFGLCRAGVCHRYEVRRRGTMLLLRYRAAPEQGGEPISTWYGYYDKDVTP